MYWSNLSSLSRLAIGTGAGVIIGGTVAFFTTIATGVLMGWDVTALAFITVWLGLRKYDAKQTSSRATREDTGSVVGDLFLLLGSLICTAGVAAALLKASSAKGTPELLFLAFGLVSVFLSWFAVHTVFALRYAKQYYTDEDGGIDFSTKEPPTYLEFAYVAFTIGMTFQVSDTEIEARPIRRTVLRHALISYFFGVILVAMTVNVAAGLFK